MKSIIHENTWNGERGAETNRSNVWGSGEASVIGRAGGVGRARLVM